MRKFLLALVFILLLILCLIFFLKFYETPSIVRLQKEKLNVPEVTITHKVEYETIAKPPKKVIVTTRKPVYSRSVKVEKPATPESPKSEEAPKAEKKTTTKPHYYYYSVRRDQTPAPTEKETAPAETERAAPSPQVEATNSGNTTYSYETSVTYVPQKPETKVKHVSEVSFAKESMLKYVLFTVNYDAHMFAGETKTLELTMSPKNALANLEKVMQEKKIEEGQKQIKALEKVQSQFKYVSAELIANKSCLKVEKKTPAEEKIYMPSITESTADQLWRWDLTAPEIPATNICNLSLFIRFCLNQNDCLPMQSPDKEFNIEIEITTGQRIYHWFHSAGNIAGIAIPIITVVACIIGYIWSGYLWRKRKSQTKSDNDPRRGE